MSFSCQFFTDPNHPTRNSFRAIFGLAAGLLFCNIIAITCLGAALHDDQTCAVGKGRSHAINGGLTFDLFAIGFSTAMLLWTFKSWCQQSSAETFHHQLNIASALVLLLLNLIPSIQTANATGEVNEEQSPTLLGAEQSDSCLSMTNFALTFNVLSALVSTLSIAINAAAGVVPCLGERVSACVPSLGPSSYSAL